MAKRDRRQSSSKAIKARYAIKQARTKVLFINFRERIGTETKRVDQGSITRTSRSIGRSTPNVQSDRDKQETNKQQEQDIKYGIRVIFLLFEVI